MTDSQHEFRGRLWAHNAKISPPYMQHPMVAVMGPTLDVGWAVTRNGAPQIPAHLFSRLSGVQSSPGSKYRLYRDAAAAYTDLGRVLYEEDQRLASLSPASKAPDEPASSPPSTECRPDDDIFVRLVYLLVREEMPAIRVASIVDRVMSRSFQIHDEHLFAAARRLVDEHRPVGDGSTAPELLTAAVTYPVAAEAVPAPTADPPKTADDIDEALGRREAADRRCRPWVWHRLSGDLWLWWTNRVAYTLLQPSAAVPHKVFAAMVEPTGARPTEYRGDGKVFTSEADAYAALGRAVRLTAEA